MYNPPDTEANRQFAAAARPGTTMTAWLTHDTFEQVLGFYRAVGRESRHVSALDPGPASLDSS